MPTPKTIILLCLFGISLFLTNALSSQNDLHLSRTAVFFITSFSYFISGVKTVLAAKDPEAAAEQLAAGTPIAQGAIAGAAAGKAAGAEAGAKSGAEAGAISALHGESESEPIPRIAIGKK